MTERILDALQAHLDDAVGALPARRVRKEQIRAELLAHLLELYDEEFMRLGDEHAALNEAVKRFGAMGELRVELRASVPFFERVLFLILGKKESVMWRLFMILGVVAMLVGLGFVCPALQQLLFGDVMTLAVTLLTFGVAVMLGGAWSIVHGIRRFRTRST